MSQCMLARTCAACPTEHDLSLISTSTSSPLLPSEALLCCMSVVDVWCIIDRPCLASYATVGRHMSRERAAGRGVSLLHRGWRIRGCERYPLPGPSPRRSHLGSVAEPVAAHLVDSIQDALGAVDNDRIRHALSVVRHERARRIAPVVVRSVDTESRCLTSEAPQAARPKW